MGAPQRDLQAFLDAMQDVRPMPSSDTVVRQGPAPRTLAQQLKRQALEKTAARPANILSTEKVEPLDPYDFLEFKKPGVQEGVYKNCAWVSISLMKC